MDINALIQDAASFSATLTSRLKEIDAVADEMVAKVESMKKEMISRKEVNYYYYHYDKFYFMTLKHQFQHVSSSSLNNFF